MPRIEGGAALIIAIAIIVWSVLRYKRAEARKAAVTQLTAEELKLSGEVDGYRQLVLALYHDAIRRERDEPLLAGQITNRITTHPHFKELLKEQELGT